MNELNTLGKAVQLFFGASEFLLFSLLAD